MKRRNFFKGLLGLIGVGSSVFLLKDVSAEPKIEPPLYQILRNSKRKPISNPKIEWSYKDTFIFPTFVSRSEWDSIKAKEINIYGVRVKRVTINGFKKDYIAHFLFEQSMKI